MIDNKNLKILIATGIYPPEIGGPAGYAKNLAEKLVENGHKVCTITYSDEEIYDIDKNLSFTLIRIKRTNKISNYLRYFFALIKNIRNYDLVYSFDHFSAGIPSVLACKIFQKKIAIRIGGDFIWELYIKKTKHGITLRDFYKLETYKKDSVRFFLIKMVFKFSNLLIFTTKFQEEIFEKPYKINNKKVHYISNPIMIDDFNVLNQEKSNDILFAGRITENANLLNVIKAFLDIKQDKFRLVIMGNGDQKSSLMQYVVDNNIKNIVFRDRVLNNELRENIVKSYAMIFPGYTDISPNTVLDCISMKTPFVVTKEHGFDWLRNEILEFDPVGVESIKNAIERIMDINSYNSIKRMIDEINYKYSYDDVVRDTLAIFEKNL